MSIEDIKYMHADTNFIFECSTQYLTCSLRSLMRYRVEHEKKNWYPQAGMKYSHQWRDAVMLFSYWLRLK